VHWAAAVMAMSMAPDSVVGALGSSNNPPCAKVGCSSETCENCEVTWFNDWEYPLVSDWEVRSATAASVGVVELAWDAALELRASKSLPDILAKVKVLKSRFVSRECQSRTSRQSRFPRSLGDDQ
jgi:hypothetical protein